MLTEKLKTSRQRAGIHAEQRACDYLENQGLVLRESNFRCRYGEIDLIMQDDDAIVFVEVRYRKSKSHGGSIASVDHFKQRKIINAAHYYLQRHQAYNLPTRFDVIALNEKLSGDIIWLKHAFIEGEFYG